MHNNVCVIGDVMLDHYKEVSPVRISGEAPVLIVHAEEGKDTFYPGGAANVAMNCFALGAETFLLGCIGIDVAGNKLLNEFENFGKLHICDNYKTIEKVRYVDHLQRQILRVDHETKNWKGLSKSQLNCFTYSLQAWKSDQELRNKQQFFDTVIISDYGKGLVNNDFARWFNESFLCTTKFSILNGKPKNYQIYNDWFNYFSLAIFNEEEAREILKLNNYVLGNNDLDILYSGLAKIMKMPVLMTCGERGMYAKGEHITAFPVHVVDVSGAGDTVVATIASKGYVNSKVLEKASYNASIVVSQYGTSVISLNNSENKEKINV